MMSAITLADPAATIASAVTEIRYAVGMVYTMHSGGSLDQPSMLYALNHIEKLLGEIMVAAQAGDIVTLPVKTLDDIVAEAKARAGAKPGCHLTVVEGGAR
ncbi:MAG: hypothetical protein WCO82_00250 [Sphingomonadales bacterium]|jgi:hypothetical protein